MLRSAVSAADAHAIDLHNAEFCYPTAPPFFTSIAQLFNACETEIGYGIADFKESCKLADQRGQPTSCLSIGLGSQPAKYFARADWHLAIYSTCHANIHVG